jgi:cation diffusion facilitator CzcD-associated flavoprotein CzcO
MAAKRVVVIGAGPGGLATALRLKDAGITPLVVERADTIGAAWRGRYDRLRLNSPRFFSHLPGRRFPAGTPMFPARDEFVAHLERHAGEEGIEWKLETDVTRIDPAGDAWALEHGDGLITARHVVVATGYDRVPFTPVWAAPGGFPGQVIHASKYKNPSPYRGQKVLVVGPGSTGMEIAHDLAENGAGKVWLSARTPPNIVLREGPAGLPGDVIGVAVDRLPVGFADRLTNLGRRLDLGDLEPFGLPVPEEGVFARMKRLGVAPAVVDKEVIEAIRERQIEVVAGVESIDARGAQLLDKSRLEPDAVICATGYRPGLEPLVGHLGVLGDRGLPRRVGKEAAAPGLYFVGYITRPAMLNQTIRDGRRAGDAIARNLRRTAAPV